MAVSNLIERLERDADLRLDALDAKATAEADALRAEAVAVLEVRRETALATRRAARRARLDAALAAARRESRGTTLQAQHALLARVYARARALVPEVAASAEYLALAPQHLAEARRYVEGVPVVVRCPPGVAAALAASDPSVTLHVDPTCPPGVIVSGADVVVDNTLAARLQRLEARLASALLAEVSR